MVEQDEGILAQDGTVDRQYCSENCSWLSGLHYSLTSSFSVLLLLPSTQVLDFNKYLVSWAPPSISAFKECSLWYFG